MRFTRNSDSPTLQRAPRLVNWMVNRMASPRMVNRVPHANLAPLAGPPTAVGARGRVYRLRGLVLPSIGAIGGSVLPVGGGGRVSC